MHWLTKKLGTFLIIEMYNMESKYLEVKKSKRYFNLLKMSYLFVFLLFYLWIL